jgi:Prokaryotic E2 family E/Multiubiquitin
MSNQEHNKSTTPEGGHERRPEVELVQEVFVDGELVELVVIEEFAKRGEKPPRAKTYEVRIDKKTYRIHKPDPTGEELLEAAGKTSAGFKLYQIFRGKQPEPVTPNQHVDLRAHGIERFTTVPKDPGEGGSAAALRRDFQLAEADRDSLDAMNVEWTTVKDGSGTLLLLIPDWRTPVGYNVLKATLVLVLSQGYPDTQIDMAYFSPALSRSDGKAINNLTTVSWSIGTFQQWSRHRTAQNPWRPGVDDISTHLSLVDDWLRREFERR